MKLILYTCIFGNYDTQPKHVINAYMSYVTITSTNLKLNNIDASRYYKILPHTQFYDYDISVYADGNFTLINPDRLMTLCDYFYRSNYSAIFFKHPDRKTVRQELDECIRRGIVSEPDNAIHQFKQYVKDGFKDNLPLTENNIIIRKHNDNALIACEEFWFNEFRNGVKRDQISLQYSQWKTNYTNYLLLEHIDKLTMFCFRRHGE